MAVNYNFIIEQGSDFEINFQYDDENGTGVDLSDISTTCCVLQMIPNSGVSKKGITSFSSRDLDTDYLLSGSDKGLISLKLENPLTKLYTFDSAVYDLDVIQDNKITRLVSGTITIEKRQTPFPTCELLPQDDENTGTGVVSPNQPVPAPDNEDLCLKTDCLDIDIYSIVYNGSSLAISDPSSVGGNASGLYVSTSVSGYVSTLDTRLLENVELVINKLNHNYPQDLQILLSPPSGNKILVDGNHKIPGNSGNFSFMFSNKAPPNAYLHNVTNGNLCNIYDKTNVIKYSNENLLSGFDHLFGHSITGIWNLIIKDTDPISSGSIDGWKLILTYKPSV